MTSFMTHSSYRDNISLTNTRREHARVPARGHVVAQVVEGPDESLIGYTFRSPIVEISPCGLRLSTSRQLSGCRLDLWLEINDHNEKMFLAADVRWTSPEEAGDYQIGVELVANPLTDIEEWCEFQRKEWFLQ